MRRLNNLMLFFRFLFTALTTICLMDSFGTYADSIDIWTVKCNGKTIISSNENEISENHPMQIHLASFAVSDTLQIVYWTDSGLERYKWFYIFKDASNSVLDKFENPIDSTVKCYPTPCKTFTNRKNYISYCVKDLEQILKNKNLSKIFVELEHDNKEWGQGYFHYPVCVISID